ncbi:MAG TPA: KGG domain-containing protein [Gemmatimonadaceae bacterium]|nr:KGG domain-containing protein [Gemmatimonadaceae bacterium]
MANSQGDNDQGLGGADRERGRDVINDGASARSASSRRSNRGFASMDPSKQKEIASKGGRAAHAKGTAHEFDSGEAREAGRKGGMAVSRNREHMAMIGRKGGEARGAKNAARLAQTGTQNASRAAAQQNSGAQSLRGDRQVNIPGVAQNTGGASDASFGGERRGGTSESSREQRPDSH